MSGIDVDSIPPKHTLASRHGGSCCALRPSHARHHRAPRRHTERHAMARIRSIKPEFWSSEQVMECARDTRLLFIGLWNFVDDADRMSFSSKQIKALIFPGD